MASKAFSERWILISNNKDFGEMVHRQGQSHHVVNLLRLIDQRSDAKIAAAEKLLQGYGDQLSDAIVVVSESQVRIAGP